ncbi:hypothetical protein CMUS01_05219 [Colletotrichum musicola]|uniref:Rhodopsin domain-containing protein n=1 Tax=Colletotrichum musicola TaxID=2175873 RepID=A0A8H6KSU2_9PEZI|nr:hypothetical protein CMUS01_05219 [Colletotrichum musicola]
MTDSTTAPKVHFMDSPNYSGDTVLRLNIALIVCTSAIVWTRLYVRAFVAKALVLGDAVALLAWGAVTTLSALDIRLVQYGSGAHLEFIPKEDFAIWFEGIVTNGLIYLIGTGLMRLSIVAFLPRLSQDRIYVMLTYITGSLIIAQSIGCVVYRLTQCSPITHLRKPPFFPGKNCVPPSHQNSMMAAHQISGLALDFSLMGLPIWVIYTRMLWSRRVFQLICVFSVGFFVVAIGCVRLAMMKMQQFLEDPTFNMSTIGIWTDLEGHVGLWVASFPALQPLIRMVSFRLGFRSKLQSYGHKGQYNNGNDGGRSNGDAWPSALRSKSRYTGGGSGVKAADSNSERGLFSSDGEIEGGGVELNSLETVASVIKKEVGVDVRVDKAKAQDDHSTRPSTRGSKSWVSL